jgi:hypothetical protein
MLKGGPMICRCGRRITRMPVLIDGHSAWIHLDGDQRIVCDDGEFATPDEEKTFARVERLIDGLRELRKISAEGEGVQ